MRYYIWNEIYFQILKNVFEIDFDFSRIVSAIKIEYGKEFNPEDTLFRGYYI